jgi:hypothetical protein
LLRFRRLERSGDEEIFRLIARIIDLFHMMGPGWVASRALYALKLHSAWFKRRTPCRTWKHEAPNMAGRFFNEQLEVVVDDQWKQHYADGILDGRFRFFSCTAIQCGLPPDWFSNPFNGRMADRNALEQPHWSEIPDFTNGDIKCIWELSRFGWVFPLLRSFQATQKEIYADACWQLITTWVAHNPPNRGVHWKCGQEITIRIFALASAYFGLGKVDSAKKRLIAKILHESAIRIEANIGYALSQQNNHGVSEATGLFTAGLLLTKKKWVIMGSNLLEEQIIRLVSPDGSFSQHSANYHRVMLHACLWAVQLGRANGFEFSGRFMERLRLAGHWLLQMYDPQTGYMPNLGANDGALILPYSVCDYLDYRPTIQATGAVLDKQRWLPAGDYDDLALWLVPDLGNEKKIQVAVEHQAVLPSASEKPAPKASMTVLAAGGYAIWSKGCSKLIFRCPQRFQHRPAQCDLLHVDFWHNGVNFLRDAGTYSYNCEEPWQSYFKGTAAHNTIQFDDGDQMPSISRFLYGKWPRLTVNRLHEDDAPGLEAGFTNWKDCYHRRRIVPMPNGFKVVDRIDGDFHKAALRWRLAPEMDWQLAKDGCTAGRFGLTIKSASETAMTIEQGWESRHYMEKTPIPVLETRVGPECRDITTFISIDNS